MSNLSTCSGKLHLRYAQKRKKPALTFKFFVSYSYDTEPERAECPQTCWKGLQLSQGFVMNLEDLAANFMCLGQCHLKQERIKVEFL